MPFTPVMESYLKPDWVASQFSAYKKSCDANCLKSGFSWPVCLEQALINVADALSCLKALPSDAFSSSNPGSNGNSFTNSLHWIATRLPPSPKPPSPPSPKPPTPAPTPSPPSPKPPTPAPTPSPPPSPHHCKVGDLVKCPGFSANCAGDQCCPDGSICPSADASFSGCAKRKTEDCTQPSPSPPSPPTPTPTPSPPGPTPAPTPTPPSPPSPQHCNVGDLVTCPGFTTKCAGDQCCPDGSICPSADSGFTGCAKEKKQDCTKQIEALIML